MSIKSEPDNVKKIQSMIMSPLKKDYQHIPPVCDQITLSAWFYIGRLLETGLEH